MSTNLTLSQQKKWKRIITGLSLLSIILAGCAWIQTESAPAPVSPSKPDAVLNISGSSTTTSIMSAIAPAFEMDSPGYRLKTMSGTGTGGGVEGVFSGALDIAAMGRAPTDEEAAQLACVPLGLGGEIPITHADVNITNLSTEEIAAIFSGEISNWSEVGGSDLPIIIYVRADTTAHAKALRKTIFGDTPFPENAQVMGGLGDMLTVVENTPGSVGFANWPAVVSTGADVQAVAVAGVEPGNPAYAATLELGICYLPERKEEMQPLVDWLLSEKGQTALRESGVIITQ